MPKKPAAKFCALLSMRSWLSVRNTGSVFVSVKFCFALQHPAEITEARRTDVKQEAILHPDRDAEVVQLLAAEGCKDLLAELVRPAVEEGKLALGGPARGRGVQARGQVSGPAVRRCALPSAVRAREVKGRERTPASRVARAMAVKKV
jgi:hypothetical protein